MSETIPLLPPEAGPEQVELVESGQCPLYVANAGAARDFCRQPITGVLPVCAAHEQDMRAHIAEELRNVTAVIPRLEKEIGAADRRKERAIARLDETRASLAWYQAHAATTS